MEKNYFQRVVSIVILAILIVLTFFLLKPILLSIIFGIILAFLFSPLYDKINKKIKSKNFSATILTVVLLIIVLVLLWYLTPVVVDQSIELYMSSQNIDFVTPLKTIFPQTFSSDQFAQQIGSILRSSVTKAANSLMNSFSDAVMNATTALLRIVVVFFSFYFVLRDKDKMLIYMRSLSPFSKKMEKELFSSSKQITLSVLYGQVVLGVVEGLVASIGFFVFGILAWSVNNLVKPVFISKRTKVNSAIILVSMVGGLLLFGLLGLILGPLIFSYLIILLEAYRKREAPSILTEEESKK